MKKNGNQVACRQTSDVCMYCRFLWLLQSATNAEVITVSLVPFECTLETIFNRVCKKYFSNAGFVSFPFIYFFSTMKMKQVYLKKNLAAENMEVEDIVRSFYIIYFSQLFVL